MRAVAQIQIRSERNHSPWRNRTRQGQPSNVMCIENYGIYILFFKTIPWRIGRSDNVVKRTGKGQSRQRRV